MKSGLEGRNNDAWRRAAPYATSVSMKSGLEGRNNLTSHHIPPNLITSLNEVRPRRPEQWLASEGRLD